MQRTFAVQPASWTKFDEWGCDWATDIDHAYRIAQIWGEECIVWMCPPSGEPMPWVRAGVPVTDAIADLIFGIPS